MKIDKDLIKKLTEHLNEFGLTELSYSDGNVTVKVGKGSKQTAATASPEVANKETKATEDPSINIVKSPMVGTAYLSAEPGAKPFVSVGDNVKKGSTILIIEAMKTMNHIQATADGEIKEMCVADGEAIEYDQVLAKIK